MVGWGGSLAAVLLAGTAFAPVAAAAGVPGAPTGVHASARPAGAMVLWTPPASDGGSPVTGYVITATPGGKTVTTARVRAFLVGGLANGTRYTFTVAAVNSAGTGKPSVPSAAVAPRPAVRPGAPGAVRAVAGYRHVTVVWRAPASDGGDPVSGYVVAAHPGAASMRVSGAARSAVLAGLANGTSYRVSVWAVTAAGRGKTGLSNAVRPRATPPDTPHGVTAAPASGSGVRLTWQAPGSDGGSAVTGYVITLSGTTRKINASAAARSVIVTGLTAGKSYEFGVAARNAKGTGPAEVSPPATAGAKVTAAAVVMSAASLTALTTVQTDGALVFTSAPTQVTGLKPGKILVAGVSKATPNGLLAQVRSVRTSKGVTTVATVPASLSKVFSSAAFGTTAELTQGTVKAFTPARPGITLAPAGSSPDCPAPSFSVTASVTMYRASNGRDITVDGSICILPRITFSASVTCCTHTTSSFTGTVTATASVRFTAELSHDFGSQNGLTLGHINLPPIRFLIGYVPIVISPTLSLKLVDKGTISAGVTAGADASVTVGSQVTTSDAHISYKPLFGTSFTWDSPVLSGSLDAAAGIQVNLSTKIDGVTGPTLTNTLWLPELTADTTKTPWWTLDIEDVLDLHYKLVLLGHPLAVLDLTVLDYRHQLAAAGGPYQGITITPVPAVVTPGGQLQLHARVAGAAAQHVQWATSPGDGTITPAGLYTAPGTPGEYQVTAAQPANGLKPAAYGVISIQAGDQPPGSPRIPAATSTDYGAAIVTWAPPDSTGGGPITGYTITARPGGRVKDVPGSVTGTTMTGLTPAAQYTFTVTAVSAGGDSLPSPATNPVTISNVAASSLWTAAFAPYPANAGGLNVDPSSITCPSATSCVAAGRYQNAANGTDGLLLTWSGGSWVAARAPVPSNAISPAARDATTLGSYSRDGGCDVPCAATVSVACMTAATCVAAGGYADSAGDAQGLLETGYGRRWTGVEAPLPAGAAAAAGASLGPVACPPGGTQCVAAGKYTDSSGYTQGVLVTGAGASWAAFHVPLPAGSFDLIALTSVTCPAVSACIAVGSYHDAAYHAQGLIATGFGTHWTVTEAPLPADAAANPEVALESVACPPGGGDCLIGGEYASTSAFEGLLLTQSGGSWDPSVIPVPPGPGAANPGTYVFGISCPSADYCALAGAYEGAYPLLVTKSGSGPWIATQPPMPDDPNPLITGAAIACTATASCVFTGSDLDGPVGIPAFVITGSGTSWTASESPLPATGVSSSPDVGVPAVTCYTATRCVAVGDADAVGLVLNGPP